MLLTEMWVRAMKNEINHHMRLKSTEEKMISDIPFKKIIIEFLNAALKNGSDFYNFYWGENEPKGNRLMPSLKWQIINKFGDESLTAEGQNPGVEL